MDRTLLSDAFDFALDVDFVEALSETNPNLNLYHVFRSPNLSCLSKEIGSPPAQIPLSVSGRDVVLSLDAEIHSTLALHLPTFLTPVTPVV